MKYIQVIQNFESQTTNGAPKYHFGRITKYCKFFTPVSSVAISFSFLFSQTSSPSFSRLAQYSPPMDRNAWKALQQLSKMRAIACHGILLLLNIFFFGPFIRSYANQRTVRGFALAPESDRGLQDATMMRMTRMKQMRNDPIGLLYRNSAARSNKSTLTSRGVSGKALQQAFDGGEPVRCIFPADLLTLAIVDDYNARRKLQHAYCPSMNSEDQCFF